MNKQKIKDNKNIYLNGDNNIIPDEITDISIEPHTRGDIRKGEAINWVKEIIDNCNTKKDTTISIDGEYIDGLGETNVDLFQKVNRNKRFPTELITIERKNDEGNFSNKELYNFDQLELIKDFVDGAEFRAQIIEPNYEHVWLEEDKSSKNHGNFNYEDTRNSWEVIVGLNEFKSMDGFKKWLKNI